MGWEASRAARIRALYADGDDVAASIAEEIGRRKAVKNSRTHSGMTLRIPPPIQLGKRGGSISFQSVSKKSAP
jgi:hypothetical protein